LRKERKGGKGFAIAVKEKTRGGGAHRANLSNKDRRRKKVKEHKKETREKRWFRKDLIGEKRAW